MHHELSGRLWSFEASVARSTVIKRADNSFSGDCHWCVIFGRSYLASGTVFREARDIDSMMPQSLFVSITKVRCCF
jgi:hypothetical protein